MVAAEEELEKKSIQFQFEYIKFIYYLLLHFTFFIQFGCSGGAGGSVTDLSSFETPQPCTNDVLILNPCSVGQPDFFITNNFGSDFTSWTNVDSSTQISANLPDGYYLNKQVSFEDPNFISSNIKLGVSLFGINGTALSAYDKCVDDQKNKNQCSTQGGRYISSYLGSNITLIGDVSAPITAGFYDGTTPCVAFDTNILSDNIRLGTKILGTTGNLIPAYDNCTDDALNNEKCTALNRYVTPTLGSSITSWTNTSSSTTLSGVIPLGFYPNNTAISFIDSNLISSNIKSGVSIFSVQGSFQGGGIELNSNAYHDKAISPITQLEETTTYAGKNMPASYRDVPVLTKDDLYRGTESAFNSQNPTYVIRNFTTGVEWNVGVSRKVCGKGINSSLSDKIFDCYTQHTIKPSWDAGVSGKISWDGTKKGSAGEGSWTLVTVYSSSLSNGAACDSSCNEVWKDNRTGLLWSDLMPKKDNWCKASGNSDNVFNNDCSTNKPAQSWCAEVGPSSMVQVNGSGEDWVNGTYTAAKGGMGKYTSIPIRWRLPTKYDFQAADINGYTKVIKDIVLSFEFWLSPARFVAQGELIVPIYNGVDYSIRCVGR